MDGGKKNPLAPQPRSHVAKALRRLSNHGDGERQFSFPRWLVYTTSKGICLDQWVGPD